LLQVMEGLRRLLQGPNGAGSRAAARAITAVLSRTREGRAWLAGGGEENGLQELLAPFQQVGAQPEDRGAPRVEVAAVLAVADTPALWAHGDSHQHWLSNLVLNLLACFGEQTALRHLEEPCQLSLPLCHTVLPFIIHELLLVDSSDIRLILSNRIGTFFKDHFDSVTDAGSSGPGPWAHERPQSVGSVLAVVTHLRQQPLAPHLKASAREQNCWENNFWLANINYLHCARAALSCGQAFSACQLGAVWCYQRERESAGSSAEGEAIRNVLHTAALMLGDRDAALGAGTDLRCPAARAGRLAMEGSHSLALPICDALATAGGPGARAGLVAALYGAGLHHVLSRYLGEQVGDEREREVQQECAWRLQQWDQLVPETAGSSVPGCVLGALEGAARADLGAVAYWRTQGEAVVTARLRTEHLETCSALHPILAQLRQLGELGHLGPSGPLPLPALEARDAQRSGDWAWLEPVLAQRRVLAAEVPALRPGLERLLLHSSKLARAAGAASWTGGLRLAPSPALRWEEALVAWASGHRPTALALARALLAEAEAGGAAVGLLPAVLLQLGKWLHEQKTETSRTILESYLARSVRLLEAGGGEPGELERAHLALAGFADMQYKQVRDYLAGGEFQERQESTRRNLQDVEVLQASCKDSKAINTARTIKERFANLDTTEEEQFKAEAEEYLGLALRHYLAVLRQAEGARSQAAVYRLVALWFANMKSPAVVGQLPAELPAVPSHKFVPLLYQLAARMEVPRSGAKDSVGALCQLILRCATQHPHHALPIVLALTHAKEDEKMDKALAKGAGVDPRGLAAAKIVLAVEKADGGRLKLLVQQYRHVSLGLIHLAYVAPGKVSKIGSKIDYPPNQSLLKVKHWAEVAVPTDTLAVRPDRDYSGVPGIASFPPTYSMVGGINAPKKMSCVGTDGRARVQLVKGKDDMRQDAVMEQVFGLLNQLLRQDEEARREKLSIRTYKVMPLSQRSGVLEWCRDTQPLAMYLVGPDQRGGAHKKYFPKEPDSSACRARLAALGGKKAAAGEREKVFREICKNFSPVMKYFFLEQFPSAGAYYLARTAYTKSAATNSMVGHMLGLGDRHTNNILVDNSTGELVHIDLGVAFEQGKILPTPEKIPFRLTRCLSFA
jgi:ataxia telangiectasia mutated family protein